MASLSRQLMTLARGLEANSAAQRRTAAQMLALATALDPGNAQAREVISEFENETHRPTPDPELVAKFKARIWQLLGWLDSLEAGSQGQALAACLADVMIVADPKHPQAQGTRSGGERGAWAGWVPVLAAYEPQVVAKVDPPENIEPDPTAAGIPATRLPSARLITPLWKQSAPPSAVKWVLAPAPLEMSAGPVVVEDGIQKRFSLTIGQTAEGEGMSPMVPSILKLLRNHYGELPQGLRVTIGSEEFVASLHSRKRHFPSAAAAVLASAAISGIEPTGMIIGVVDPTGGYQLPPGFWNYLQSLGPSSGGRVVLPAAAAGFLPSMLALERPQIFFDHEILVATNFKELLEMSAKSPTGTLAKVSAQFREIREKAGTQPLGPYVANPFIRRRLAEIVQEAPWHCSARMLSIQGSGSRPTFIPRGVLAAELRRAIEPMDWMLKRTDPIFTDTEIAKIGTTFEICRDQVADLLRHTEKNDRELVERVEDMVAMIRLLDRAAKTRGETYEVQSAMIRAQAELSRKYAEITAELARESGEVVGFPAP